MENRATILQKILQQNAAIMIVDADYFKKINDSFGHPAGDAALIEIARRIQLNVRDSDIVVRWGGEEFLICSFACDAAQAGLMVTRILAELRSTPMEFDGKLIQLSASIGYVLMPLQWRANMQLSFEDSIKFADAALYLAKAKGRNRAIGLEKMISSSREPAQLFDQLEDAASKGEIQLKEIIGVDFP
jgi:diguanylate cyclase (GGDEF)-like protein